MVKTQKEKGWDFLFLAANIDAVQTAKTYGIEEEFSVDYRNDEKGVAKNFETLSKAMSGYREKRVLPAGWAEEIREDFKKRRN